MTPGEMRVAIAEACGWRPTILGNWPTQMIRPGMSLGQDGCVSTCPNYPADLNACHEMEKVLTPEQQVRYSMTLHEMHGIPLATFWHRVICSTAPQRCEAFLKTLNLWKP